MSRRELFWQVRQGMECEDPELGHESAEDVFWRESCRATVSTALHVVCWRSRKHLGSDALLKWPKS